MFVCLIFYNFQFFKKSHKSVAKLKPNSKWTFAANLCRKNWASNGHSPEIPLHFDISVLNVFQYKFAMCVHFKHNFVEQMSYSLLKSNKLLAVTRSMPSITIRLGYFHCSIFCVAMYSIEKLVEMYNVLTF